MAPSDPGFASDPGPEPVSDEETQSFPLQRTWALVTVTAGALFAFNGIRTSSPLLAVLGLAGVVFGAFVLSSRLVLAGSVLTRRLAGQARGSVDLTRLDSIEVLPDNRPRLTLADDTGGRLRIRPKNYARERALHQAVAAVLPDGGDDGWLSTAF